MEVTQGVRRMKTCQSSENGKIFLNKRNQLHENDGKTYVIDAAHNISSPFSKTTV
jgi:hypothetical protein